MANPEEEPLIPRLLASNALRANLSKHMTLNQMADSKAAMILTAASLVSTIALTQFDTLPLLTVLILITSGILAVIFSILAILPPLHATGKINYFYFRSFSELEEEEFIAGFKELITDKQRLYDAYLHELYYLGKYRLTRKYLLVRNGLWTLLFGLLGGALSALASHLLR